MSVADECFPLRVFDVFESLTDLTIFFIFFTMLIASTKSFGFGESIDQHYQRKWRKEKLFDRTTQPRSRAKQVSRNQWKSKCSRLVLIILFAVNNFVYSWIHIQVKLWWRWHVIYKVLNYDFSSVLFQHWTPFWTRNSILQYFQNLQKHLNSCYKYIILNVFFILKRLLCLSALTYWNKRNVLCFAQAMVF